ncbi:MAG: histidine phosphatase family protein [Proteobacteria bacterium]|nr:histidine phosphatase family protein [Pseudomonadota bacterium]
MTKMLNRLVGTFALLFTVCPIAALAAPAQVIIIRHGEKPPRGNELNKQGWQRARALVDVFKSNAQFNSFGPAVAIYAQKPKDSQGSLRSIQTVTPLAQSLGLTIDSFFLRAQQQQLANDILHDHRYDGRMVVICWEHNAIPRIVEAFGYLDGPSNWDGDDVYDRAWVLSFSGEEVVSFADVPQQALPGDSTRQGVK